MAKTPLEEVNSALAVKSERIVEVMDLWDGEKTPTSEQKTAWQDEISGLEAEVKSLNDQRTALESEAKATDARALLRQQSEERLRYLRGSDFHVQHSGNGSGSAAKSIGAQFAESDALKSWFSNHAPTGELPKGKNGGGGRLPDSNAMAVGTSIKTIVTGLSTWDHPADTSGGALVSPRFRGLVDEGIWQIPLGVADIVTHEATNSDVIFYVKVDSGTAAALTVAEATSESDTSGSKPQGALTFVQGTALVKTIAIWVPVTRQAFSNSDQLRGVIDRYLRYELMRELSRNIIDGDGSGEEFVGVQNLPSVLTQTTGADNLAKARKAITNLLLNGRTTPNAYVMHPTDAEGFDLFQDAEDRYYFGGPANSGVPRLWGVPIRQSEFVTLGAPILGDWTRYVVADREQATLRVSDSHASYFIRNMLAILDEMRAAGYSERDQAFCIITLAAWA